MKLLMLTRKVDYQDVSPAGFAYTWVKKLGEKLEKLYVITWQKSERGDLPKNIEIISLPENKLAKLIVLKIKLLSILPKVNGVFCHQNPEYTILAAPLAKIFNKKIVSWYTHKEVNWKLRLMNLLTDKILTASLESCRLKNRKKIEVIGHGIDLEEFIPLASRCHGKTILSIGRISPVKDYQTLIEAVDILVKQKEIKNLAVQIIGGPVLKSDQKYLEGLEKTVQDKNLENYIKFLGPIPYNQIVPYYQKGDLFINLSQTGSVDKAVLGAMACQIIVLTSNEAFKDILRDERLMFEPKNPADLADKIIALMELPEEEKEKISRQLREEVIKNHNLDNLVVQITSQFQ